MNKILLFFRYVNRRGNTDQSNSRLCYFVLMFHALFVTLFQFQYDLYFVITLFLIILVFTVDSRYLDLAYL